MKKSKKITVAIILMVIFSCLTCTSCYASTKNIVGSVDSFPIELSYQDISDETEYEKLVDEGKNNLKKANAYSIEHYYIILSDTKNTLIIKNLEKNYLMVIAGKDFAITKTDIWYTDTSDMSVNNFFYGIDEPENSILVVNFNNFNITEG